MPLRDDLDRATAAFHGSWRWLARASSSGWVAERDGILVTATGLPDVTLNPAHVRHEPADPTAAVRWSAEARASVDPPGTGIDLPAGRWPRVEAALAGLGYVERVRRPAMIAATAPAPQPAPAALSIRVVADEADWAPYVEIQVAVFGLDARVAQEFPTYGALRDPHGRLLVGAVDGEVVTTASVFLAEGVAGLYAVATREEHRGRGYGGAITTFATAQAAAMGASHVALQASADGYPVYRRLGFRDVGDWVVWVDPAVE